MTHETQTTARSIDWSIVAFFVIAYVIAWSMIPILDVIAHQSGVSGWAELSVIGEAYDFSGIDLSVPGWLVYLITRIQDFAFSIAGVIMIGVTSGREGLANLGKRLVRWRFKWTWYVLALLPFGLYFLASVAAGAIPSFQVNATILEAALISLESGFLVTLFLRGAMGEEPGLRGFALPRLQSRMTSFRASLIIGILWGAWHIPVLLQRDTVTIIAFLLLAIGLSFIFTFLFNSTKGSLIPVLLFHAAQNSEEVFERVFPSLIGTDWELISTLGLLVSGIVFGVIAWRMRYSAKTD
jgi:membrane protease YdiL (CAAX protease family)